MIHDTFDLSGVFGSQQNHIAEKYICVLHDKDFELSTQREIVKFSEDCEKMLRRETDIRVEKSGCIKNELSVRLEQVTVCRILYKRNDEKDLK